ncbi:MAG: hypothetical protein IKN94_09225 [Salinivirgaceae bacterium]|nr:hypothetical protein [Salinivirgaceae bacterium]
MKRILFLMAIATIVCSCNNEDRVKQRSINDLKSAVIEFSKISSLLNGTSQTGVKSVYVDSIAHTIKRNMSYEQKLLKIYEIEFSVANELAYAWVNSSVEKYMDSDSTNVIMTNGEEKNANRFRLAIAQNLIDAQTQLNICNAQNPISCRDLSEMSFTALTSYNTFFFCYYFLTDNKDYLQFFSRNSEKVHNLKTYADTVMACDEISDKMAFEMASTLESTAFIITMSTLSFNALWNNYSDRMDEMADFFNANSEKVITAFFETSDKSEIEFMSEKEYADYLKKATQYKVELMNMVVNEIRRTEQ